MRPRIRAVAVAAGASALLAALAGAATSTLPPPLLKASGQGTALTASGTRITAAATCDVRVVDPGAKPRLLKRVGLCREDRFDSAVVGLWLGRKTIVEQQILSPSPHGDTYELWAGPVSGALHQVGGDWGWTDSDEPPTYGCDRMVAAGGGVVAVTPAPNDLGDGSACTGNKTTKVTLLGGGNPTLTLNGSWGVVATNGKRVALVGFDQDGGSTGQLAMIGVDGRRLGAPSFAQSDVRTAFQGWLTPVGLFLDSKRGLVGPGSHVLVKRYDAMTIGEGRAVYVRGHLLRARRLKGGPDRVIMKLPTVDAEVAGGSNGVAVLTGTISEHSAVYRIPWKAIDHVLPR